MTGLQILSLRAGLIGERLEAPRLVQLADGKPAVLIGWITDLGGRRLYAEIVQYGRFVPVAEVAASVPRAAA